MGRLPITVERKGLIKTGKVKITIKWKRRLIN